MKLSNIDDWICKTENWSDFSRKKLEDLQLFRLNELLHRLKKRQGFYKNLPEQLNSLRELQLLPFTTAQMLASHPGQFLLTSQSEISRIISGATSGTSGPSKRVFYTEKDTAHTVTFFATGIGEMVTPQDRVLIAFPFSGPFGLGDLIEQAVHSLGACSIRADFTKSYAKICEHIHQMAPDCYIGFPAALLSVARMYQTIYASAFPIKRALVSGDSCPPGMALALEQLLESPLFPHYGSRETGLSGAITCPAHEGMHLKENHVIAEIIPCEMPNGNEGCPVGIPCEMPNGNQGCPVGIPCDHTPVPDGTWGELVITTIGLEAMPLIRYRTGDYTRLLADPCPCGSVTKRLDTVYRLKTGPVSMEELDNLLFFHPSLVDYQATLSGSHLHLQSYTVNGSSLSSISDKLEASFPGFTVTIEEKKCLPQNLLLYPGKRFIRNKA